MAITRGSFSALLAPGLRSVYMETGKERPVEYAQWINVDQMGWNGVTDRQISGLGTMPAKDEGSQFTLDQPILGGTKTYTATPFGLGIEITYEMWRDELYGVMKELIAGLARAGRNRFEVSAHSVLNNAFSTSYAGFTASESLCSTAHTGLDGTSRANRPSPDVSFGVTGVQNSLIRFEGMTDERGLPRMYAPSMALIAPANKFVAREVLGSTNKPYSAQNEINALIQEDLSWMVDHYLTTSTYWFLLATKDNHDLRMGVRDNPIFDSFDDPRTKNAVFTAYQRHTTGQYGSWRGVDGSTG